ncbi:MAG: hypothetical protein IT260_00245 [Saprospiraceae bacterium]|nr:hypothetical protein [Saprospiraceae bacterium]
MSTKPSHFRLLLRTFLLMDLRGQHYARATGAKPGELIPPLYWVIGQYLFISAVTAIALFGRVDVLPYTFVMLTLSALLSISAVVVEFNEVALNFTDTQVIGHIPVHRRAYAAARIANLIFYLLLFSVALVIFPAIIGAALRGSDWSYTLVYAFAACCANLIFPLLAILLYTLRPPEPDKSDFRDVMAWTQIVLALVVFYGAQMMLRDGQHRLEMFLSYPPAWMHWVPTWWLAQWVTEMVQGNAPAGLLWGAVIALLTVALLAFTLYRLASFYRAIRTGYEHLSAERTPAPSRGIQLLSGWLASGRAQRSSVQFVLLLLRRDPDLRMRMLPQVATLAALVLLGLMTGQMGNPFAGGGSTAQSPSMAIAVVQILVISVPMLMHNFLYSRDFESSWLLWSAPAGPRGSLHAHSVRRVVLWLVVLPVCLVLGLVFAWRWQDPVSALLHLGLGWLQCVIISYVALEGIGLKVPFSEPLAKGGLSGKVAPLLAAVATGATFLGFLEFFAAQKLLYTAIFAVLLLCLFAFAKFKDGGSFVFQKNNLSKS